MEKQDECTIVFARHTRKDELLLRIENQNQSTERTYEIDPRNKEVNFTLHVLANVVKAEASMDVHFEESDRGPEFIGTCTFKSFKPLEYIVIKGVEHVQNLNFNFKRE
ncbi:jg15449 [Pararge aegeria aegeria]|uniref:Jg15449 protein n=2 Tax=Pararge aegeria TaxID=116150 RepID=A0A8S4S6G2_9NEOP|nr:jg15449 [Pararge aegeria aegeria]